MIDLLFLAEETNVGSIFHAGIPVGDALALLSEEADYKEILEGMAQKADDGVSLSECFRESGRFPAYVCGLIDVGGKERRIYIIKNWEHLYQ